MGVGQPLSMKLKNVHLPHPHPNGSFCDPSRGGGLVVLSLLLAVVTTAGDARDVLSVQGGVHIVT